MQHTRIVCRGSQNRPVFHEFGIDVLRCTNCGHVFSSHHAPQHYDGYFAAESVASRDQFWWDDAHRDMYDDFCQRFLAGRSGRLLDVGCGLGFFVRHASKHATWEVSGCDVSKPAIAFAMTRLHLRSVRCGSVDELGLPKSAFDIITLWDVIEHIPNPDLLLSHLACLLKEDGMLFMHTPNVKIQLPKAKLRRLLRGMHPDLHYLEARDHLHIYSMQTIQRVLYRNGLRRVQFTHLRPIRSVAGSRNRALGTVKNAWCYASQALYSLSGGRLNLDNLFVIARR